MEVEDVVEDLSVKQNQVIVERNFAFDEATKKWEWSSPKTIDYGEHDRSYTIEILRKLIQSPDLQAEIIRPKRPKKKLPRCPVFPWPIKEEIDRNVKIINKLLENGDLPVEQLSALRAPPEPVISDVDSQSLKADSGVESMVSFNSNENPEEPFILELWKIYLIPNNCNKRWVTAKLLHIGEDALYLADDVMFNNITTTKKKIAFAEPPTGLLKIGSRVVGLKKQMPSTGEISQGRRKHEVGVVAEFPTNENLHRYLIIFDDGDWTYVNPDEVRLLCYQSRNAWDDVPDNNKHIVCNFLCGLYKSMADFEKGDLVVYEIRPNDFEHGIVVKVDVSILYVWFFECSKCIVIYKGLPNFRIR